MNQPVIVVLAAGASRRFGQPKQLIDLGGQSLLRHGVGQALATGYSVSVVLGHAASRLAAEIDDFDVHVLVHPGWADGMGSSIACAARDLLHRQPTSPMLLMLADQPGVGRAQLCALIERQRRTAARIAIADYGSGQCGPPALFAASLLPELARLRGDYGARTLLQAYRSETTMLEMPEAAFDINTPADLHRWRTSPV